MDPQIWGFWPKPREVDRGSIPLSDDGAPKLDLQGYQDREIALGRASGGCPEDYTAIARESLGSPQDLAPETLVFMAMLSRARGLQEGVFQALKADNPHAAFPLLRAFTELVAVLYYCLQKPKYVARLAGIGAGSEKSYLQFRQLFEAVSDVLPGMKSVYSELSAYTHFEQLAVYNVHTIEDISDRSISWTDVPRWKSEDEFRIACAQLSELSEAVRHGLRRFAAEILCNDPGSE